VFEDGEIVFVRRNGFVLVVFEVKNGELCFAVGELLLEELEDVRWRGHWIRNADDVWDVPEGTECWM